MRLKGEKENRSRVEWRRTALRFALSAAAFGFLSTTALRAQVPAPPEFDVASVKLSNPDARQTGFNFQPDGVIATNITLRGLITVAYDLPFLSSRISGGPEWAQSARFDIEAKTTRPSGISVKDWETRLKVMLQRLLEERFQLTVRRETREAPVYALLVAKGGPKLKKAAVEEKDCPEGPEDASSCHLINGGAGRGLHAKAVDIADIAQFVSNWTDRPIIDRTGLQGLFELDTEGWTSLRSRAPRPDQDPTPEDLAQTDPTQPTVFMMFGKLGLKLEPQKGPIETIVIVRVQKPSAN